MIVSNGFPLYSLPMVVLSGVGMGWAVPDALRRYLLSDREFKELKFMEACKAGGSGDVDLALAILSELDEDFEDGDFLSKRSIAIRVGTFFCMAAHAKTRIPGAYLLRIIDGARDRRYRHPTLAVLAGLSENSLYVLSTAGDSSAASLDHSVPAPHWGALLVCHSILGLWHWPEAELSRYEAYLRGGLGYAGFPDKIPAFAVGQGLEDDQAATASIEDSAQAAYRQVSNALGADCTYRDLTAALNACSRLHGRLTA